MTWLIDYFSDLHLDFWVKPNAPEYVQRKQIIEFISRFLPENPSPILVIAGDIGHDNDQNLLFFEILQTFYKRTYWTHGNHDLYLLGDVQRNRYDSRSFNRLNELIRLSSEIEGNFYLSGTVEVEKGFVIGGFPMWYDFSYGVEVCLRSPIYLHQLWRQWMADSRLIIGGEESQSKFDTRAYAASQRLILEKNYELCNLIFSHVAPDWSNLKPQYVEDPTSAFFHFDGREILRNCGGKTWVFGHTHEMYDYFTESGCHMLCNPMGYPGEQNSYGERNIEGFEIKTLKITPAIQP